MRHPAWPEIKECLEDNLEYALNQLPDAMGEDLFRLTSRITFIRQLLQNLPQLPDLLDNIKRESANS